MTATLVVYWKQFVGLVTGLKNKYWHDPFVKSEVNVVLLQLLFGFSLFLIAYIFFNYLYQDILQTIVNGIIEGIASGNPESREITNSLEIAKSSRFLAFTILVLLITLGFTFLITKITLRPVKNALKSQKRFISDIAHELRTPLSIIKTNSEVFLMDKDTSDPTTQKMIEDNIEELDRISEIINNLLSFNNLVRPEKIKFSNVDMGPIIDISVSKLKDLAHRKDLEITVKKVAPHVVWGNAVALEQIVTNLVKNAINYTQESGHITIRVGPDYYGNVIIHVEDTGIGITREDLLHIFEPFYRAERSRNREHGSSGLGLTIVSELVKIHSGRITIKSAENKGTVAIVTLPYGKKGDIEMQENIDLANLNEVSISYLGKHKN